MPVPPPASDPGWHPFDALTPSQRDQLAAYQARVLDFNRTLNLVSRESARHLEVRHVVHSLMLARKAFPAGSTVVDWGTGGGLPGIPLAIRFPEVRFVLVDSVGKKIRAVQAMIRALGLPNVQAVHTRAEAWTGTAAYSVSRATAPLVQLWTWHRRIYEPSPVRPGAGDWPPGLLCLKGGALSGEIRQLQARYPDAEVQTLPLALHPPEPLFEGKIIVCVR